MSAITPASATGASEKPQKHRPGLGRKVVESLNPKDRPWATSPNGWRLVVPRSTSHFRSLLDRARITPKEGWEKVCIAQWSGEEGFDDEEKNQKHPDAEPGTTLIVAVPAYQFTPELAERLSSSSNAGGPSSEQGQQRKRTSMVHRIKRSSLSGRIESEMSELQRGLFTDESALKLLSGVDVHYIEWACVIMCNGANAGCLRRDRQLRCNGTLVLDEDAKFPGEEVKKKMEAGEKTIAICVAGAPTSVMNFVRRGRALGHECDPMGAPKRDQDAASVLVTDLMTLRLHLTGLIAANSTANLNEVAPPPPPMPMRTTEDGADGAAAEEGETACGFYDKPVTCPADVEMSFQEAVDWSGSYQLAMHGIAAGAVISFESMKSELNSMLAHRHLASNDSDTEKWVSMHHFIWWAMSSVFPTTVKGGMNKLLYTKAHLGWLGWAMPEGSMTVLPAVTAILCAACVAFAVTDFNFEVTDQLTMWWSMFGLIGLTVATYTVGQLVLFTFYATTAARLALDRTTLAEILRVRSVRVLSWVGVFTMMRVHSTGVASALFGAGLLGLGVLSTQVFQVDHVGGDRIRVSAAPMCFILGAGYGTSLILATWLASSLRLSCISNAGARRALYLLSDDLAFVNALAGSPLLKTLDGMCDATPDELCAALAPRSVQFGASKVIRPADSMTELGADVERIDRAAAVDVLAKRYVGHLVLDLDERVGRADHGMYA
ncbi:hypothetical protein DFJ77DRAFT_550106 [Powellomyces hirtus]|nr:hypothetical protein DFJ77DRAFT_282283 [Powellomyces hirtus]KAI8910510.1 hypothetical protein DFJ77DRAFT_550106 [Powellomyces hirtus]